MMGRGRGDWGVDAQRRKVRKASWENELFGSLSLKYEPNKPVSFYHKSRNVDIATGFRIGFGHIVKSILTESIMLLKLELIVCTCLIRVIFLKIVTINKPVNQDLVI